MSSAGAKYQFSAIDVFPDGASLANVLDAIRVTWIADRGAALDLAQRYNMSNICLRCAQCEAVDQGDRSRVQKGAAGLCAMCFWKTVDDDNRRYPNPLAPPRRLT